MGCGPISMAVPGSRSAIKPPPATVGDRPVVLCVDDEPSVLEGVRDTLRRAFTVRAATSGADGLALLRCEPRRYAVVISDMRMPVMSGSAFLQQARRVAPLATRMLLTGHADAESAMRAVNDGQIFRFLVKPCQPDELLQACTAALWQHRLLETERALVEEMVQGCVRALSEVLALASPAASAHGMRARAAVASLMADIGLDDGWELEAAALLAGLGAIALPAATAAKLCAGEPLSEAEAAAAGRVPAATERILRGVPRLEGVLQILAAYGRRFDSIDRDGMLPLGARALRIVFDFDALTARGVPPERALAEMAGRDGVYDPELLTAFAAGRSHHGPIAVTAQ